MYVKIYTPPKPHPYSSIYLSLFSGHDYDHNYDPSKYQAAYNKAMALSCHHNPTPITNPFKQDPGPHRQHKILKNYQQGRINYPVESFNEFKRTQGNKIIVLIIPPMHFFFLRGLITGGQEVGAIYYCIGCIIIKPDITIIDFLFPPLLVSILPVETL